MQNHPHAEVLRAALQAGAKDEAKDQTKATLDSADEGGTVSPAMVEAANIRTLAVASVQEWCETGDLEGEEGSADRLIAMLIGIADENKDGELSEDEQEVAGMAMEAAADYLASKGVSDEDLDALFGDDIAASNSAGDRICEWLKEKLPDGDAADEELDGFTFDADALSPALDAVYKKRFAVRAGRKVIVRKRVSGTVRLSAAQKVAIRKARMKSQSAGARMRRMKSAKLSRKMGLSA
jgi:hypothetical protein